MIEVVNKDPPAEMYAEVVCKRCGWTYRYLPHQDAIKTTYTDMGGGSELWWYIPCSNEACHDPAREGGITKIEVKNPRG